MDVRPIVQLLHALQHACLGRRTHVGLSTQDLRDRHLRKIQIVGNIFQADGHAPTIPPVSPINGRKSSYTRVLKLFEASTEGNAIHWGRLRLGDLFVEAELTNRGSNASALASSAISAIRRGPQHGRFPDHWKYCPCLSIDPWSSCGLCVGI